MSQCPPIFSKVDRQTTPTALKTEANVWFHLKLDKKCWFFSDEDLVFDLRTNLKKYPTLPTQKSANTKRKSAC